MQSQGKAKKSILYGITQDTWGGAQRYVFDLSTTFAKKGHRITVAIGDEIKNNGLTERLMAHNAISKNSQITVIHLSHLKREVRPISDIKAIRELITTIKLIQPDIVHLNSSKIGVIGSIARLFLTSPLIYTAHGWAFLEPISPFSKLLYFLLEYTTAFVKKSIICVSPLDKKIIDTYFWLLPKKSSYIPLGIKQQTILQKTDARNYLSRIVNTLSNSHHKWIGCIANLYPTKGIDILIDAVAKLPDNIKVFIIGAGPEQKSLEKRIQKNKLEKHVFLCGFIPDASKYISAFDIFVLTSRKEGLPYSILEARQAAIPVVASAVGGIPSLAEHDKGLTVRNPQPSEIAKAIHEVLTKQKEKITRAPSDFDTMIKKTMLIYEL